MNGAISTNGRSNPIRIWEQKVFTMISVPGMMLFEKIPVVPTKAASQAIFGKVPAGPKSKAYSHNCCIWDVNTAGILVSYTPSTDILSFDVWSYDTNNRLFAFATSNFPVFRVNFPFCRVNFLLVCRGYVIWCSVTREANEDSVVVFPCVLGQV
ncbi:unnamed protein product [Acanthoscelides obtectus]|uniref:Uncharacterized protein n=1 Tax=Acanthoscelides obtectus TaxID=200917 RepID=A0A9P0QA68_ACAOB|nr:unnamed protein product [Acanthoscelides obtectus]CAK1663250.1 hypothetical protein AOBTE_LOCUS23572 [Acanthoscelides obtectus]